MISKIAYLIVGDYTTDDEDGEMLGEIRGT